MTKNEDIVSPEIIEAMGIRQTVFEEIQCIIGRMPTVDDLSTLLAMWEGNGRQQSLLTWLRGMQHAVEKQEYLYTGSDHDHQSIREPKVRECLEIAHSLFPKGRPASASDPFATTGEEIYLVGNISTDFLDSDYARKYLHIVSEPIQTGSEEGNLEYTAMILDVLKSNATIHTVDTVGQGGIFGSLLRSASPNGLGFDILTCREIRLDAFLFGEEEGRFIVSLAESEDDFFLLKMDEARINCCFLGRTTKGRILVDGMDFGPSTDFGI